MLINPAKLPSPTILEAFFFEAMNAVGYASGTPNTRPHPWLEGFKIIEYGKKLASFSLRFTDQWNDRGGYTKIELLFGLSNIRQIELWFMAYAGHYDREVLYLVKRELAAAYREEKFYGGRGKQQATDLEKNLVYVNDMGGTFQLFRGEEMVCKYGGRGVYGRHRVWGGLVFPYY